MISGPAIDKRTVGRSAELATPFYLLFLGRHIHHGLWNGDESRPQALINLMEAVVREARLRGGERVLDVGCGVGTSAVHLAKVWGCDVTGVTLSRVQKRCADLGALCAGARSKTHFLAADAETVDLPPASFDLIWVIECAEYLFDKPGFARRLAYWLKPGGRAVVCAWEAGDGPLSEESQRRVYEVCAGFGYPSLASGEEFRRWFLESGLEIERRDDWTSRVTKTWEVSWQESQRSPVHWLARLAGRKRFTFWDHYFSILTAYRTGAMKYECWNLTKPTAEPASTPADSTASPAGIVRAASSDAESRDLLRPHLPIPFGSTPTRSPSG